MASDQLRYDRMVERALRGVVRDALRHVERRGLPGTHHFYLSFRTQAPGVDIPEYLVTKYPIEMTIVLQYQFFGLEVDDEKFSITLSFNNVHERLTVPFAAITTFADPSVNFALQFQSVDGRAAGEGAPRLLPTADEAAEGTEGVEKRGEVVALDAFRKK